VLREVVLATVAVACVLLAVELGARVLPWVGSQGGALVAAAFVGVPLYLARRKRIQGDALGIEGGSLAGGLLLGLLASVAILLPFALGFHLLQTRVAGAHWGDGPGLASPGLAFEGRPERIPPGHAALYEHRRGLAVENGTGRALTVLPSCAQCTPIPVSVGGVALLQRPASDEFTLRDPDARPVPTVAGRQADVVSEPVQAAPGLGWLAALLLGQLVVVALPEEIFFRGYVLHRLRQVLPPRRRLLGVPFGSAHVLAAVLFALVHLVAIPSPHRLLVFFPGLLFAWLAERGGSVVAPAVHHTFANVTLQVLHRMY